MIQKNYARNHGEKNIMRWVTWFLLYYVTFVKTETNSDWLKTRSDVSFYGD